MILVGKKVIVDFALCHPQSRNPLAVWEQIIKETVYNNFNELKLTFPSADYAYHQYTIFNISGNKYRLITEIEYSASVVSVKHIWTHAEYNMKNSEDAMRRGKL